MSAAGALLRLLSIGASVELAGSGFVLNDPQEAANDADYAVVAQHALELMRLALTPRERAIFALSRVNQPGVSITVGGEVLRSCPEPDIEIIRRHAGVWDQFTERVMVLISLGESDVHATRRAYLEIV